MYLAGITVLKKIKAEFGEISLRLNIPLQTLEAAADGHLAKHLEGLAYISSEEKDFASASQYLSTALHTKFSLKTCLKLLYFICLRFGKNLQNFFK